ncbi:hypothetical protein Tco_0491271 [Tanacetum coccineum]
MTCSTAITPDSPKTVSLIMVNKHLDIIPETDADEFIKSSVEKPGKNPSESEDECEYDVPDCDDSQTTNFSTFSNPLFDDSTSSDDESSHEEVRGKLITIPPRIVNREHEEYISLLEEDSDSLREEIDIFLGPDDSIPPGIESDDYDSEGDDNSTSLPDRIHEIFATLSPVIDTSLLFSSENEDKVFNYGVLASKEKSPHSSSHRGFKASKPFHHKSPMLIYGEDIPNLDIAPDYEASRARGFVLRSLELQSFA